jgi:hypothetical protein
MQTIAERLSCSQFVSYGEGSALVLHAQSYAIAEPLVDLRHPSVVRVYDFLLGGSANWAIDREFGERVLRQFPEMGSIARANRMFLSRVVRHLARRGVRQFLDIGSGVLSRGNTHQIAEQVASDCRVVYVDNEPVVVAHAEVLLDEEGDPDRHAVICANLQCPDQLWQDAFATGILDPKQPVAVLMSSVLHVFGLEPDGTDIAAQSLARYRELLPVGSYLGISHVTDEGIPPDLAPKLLELKHLCDAYRGFKVYCRSPWAIEALFGDFELVQPGLVWTPQWHPEEADAPIPYAVTPNYAAVRAGVGQKVR